MRLCVFKNICLCIWMCVCISNCLCMYFTVRLSSAQPLKLKVYEVLAVTSLTPDWPITLRADRAVSGGELGFGPTHNNTNEYTNVHSQKHSD